MADSPISQLAAQQKGSRCQGVLFIKLDTLWVPKHPYRRRIHCYTARTQQKERSGGGAEVVSCKNEGVYRQWKEMEGV